MSDIKAFKVQNLRSFGSDSEYIEFKNINILVGKNSSGKSTFLRTFPLLRQSIEAKTKSPILWFGRYGDFNTAVNSNKINTESETQKKKISFNFMLNLSVDKFKGGLESFFRDKILNNQSRSRRDPNNKQSISLTCCLETEANKQILRIIIKDVEIQISYDACTILELKINHNTINKEFIKNDLNILRVGSLIPISITEGSKERNIQHKELETILSTILQFGESIFDINDLNKYLNTLLRITIEDKQQFQFITELNIYDTADTIIRLIKKVFSPKKDIKSLLDEQKEEIYQHIFFYIIIIRLNLLLERIDETLASFYSKIRYLGPFRASAERFYRHQDLQVDEIDHKGDNLAMLLNSLDATKRKELSQWMKEEFGFEFSLQNQGLHYEIYLQETNQEDPHNVSDMGFGYSQILPIIVSIWLENNRIKQNKNEKTFIVIEQPELHLHPKLQYSFGIAISKLIRLTNNNIYFFLETHSQHIINAIGESIENKTIHKDKVNITLFEKNKDGFTVTRSATFDNNGYLNDWPAGFLSP